MGEKATMNLYQKLIEVRKAVPFLKKENNGYQFKYVSSSQTLAALREAMDANQLILVPKVIATEIRDHTTKKGDHNYFTILHMEFTWVNADNPDEKEVCRWIGQGLDDGEKGVGKALTYAEKYFMLKFFNVPTDKDDPDANQQPPAKTAPPKPTAVKPAAKPAPVSKEDAAIKKQIADKMKEQGLIIPAEQKALFEYATKTKGVALKYFLNNFSKLFDAWVAANDEKAVA